MTKSIFCITCGELNGLESLKDKTVRNSCFRCNCGDIAIEFEGQKNAWWALSLKQRVDIVTSTIESINENKEYVQFLKEKLLKTDGECIYLLEGVGNQSPYPEGMEQLLRTQRIEGKPFDNPFIPDDIIRATYKPAHDCVNLSRVDEDLKDVEMIIKIFKTFKENINQFINQNDKISMSQE